MDVSFKGISNVGAQPFIKGNLRGFRFIAQLDDKGFQDLTEFKDVFEKFPDPSGKGFLRIDNIHWGFKNATSSIAQKLNINGKPLIANDENIPIFSKITQLMNICSTPKWLNESANQRSFPLDNSYLNSQECLDNYLTYVNNESPEYIKKILPKFHDFDKVVTNVAKKINAGMQRTMQVFLDNDSISEETLEGIKNLSAEIPATSYDPTGLRLTLHIDPESKEYKKFQDLLKYGDFSTEEQRASNDCITIDQEFDINKSKKPTTVFYLNHKKVENTDENLSLLSKIGLVTKGISESKKPFKIDFDYIDKYKADLQKDGFLPEEGAEDITQELHTEESIKESAKSIFKGINRTINEMLDITV